MITIAVCILYIYLKLFLFCAKHFFNLMIFSLSYITSNIQFVCIHELSIAPTPFHESFHGTQNANPKLKARSTFFSCRQLTQHVNSHELSNLYIFVQLVRYACACGLFHFSPQHRMYKREIKKERA